MEHLRLPEPSKLLKRMPVVLDNRCGGSGWDPENPEKLCRACLGTRVIVNLPWTRHVRPKAPRLLTPTQVLQLRGLDCKLEDYPATGTTEWAAFIAEYEASKRARLDKMREALVAKWGPNGPPRRVRVARRRRR